MMVMMTTEIVIFTTDENLRLLSEAREFYMDGTFSTCPALFAQVFTVHIILYGHSFPMAPTVSCLENRDRHTTALSCTSKMLLWSLAIPSIHLSLLVTSKFR